MIDRPFDEAFLRSQVQNIETVDPRREDHQRRFVDLVGGGAILHELVERRFVHDLARRRGQVHAQLECLGIGVGQLPLLQIVDQVAHTLEQVLALGLDRAFQHYRIGENEVIRAHRVDQRSGREFQLFALLRCDTFDLLGCADKIFGHHQICLMQQGESRMRAPLLCCKATILARQCICFGRVLSGGSADKTAQHTLPDRHCVPGKLLCGFDRSLGNLLGHALRESEPLRRVERIGSFAHALATFGHEFEPHRLDLARNGGEFTGISSKRRDFSKTGHPEFAHHLSHRFALHIEEGAERLAAELHEVIRVIGHCGVSHPFKLCCAAV